MLRVGIVGGTGKLGREVISLLLETKGITIGAVVVRKNNPSIGLDIGSLVDNRKTGISISDDIIFLINSCDLYIDCTNAESFINDNYDSYVLANKPLIIATTGFESEHMIKISKLSQSIPVVISPNFSIGVYKFLKLVRLAASEYGFNSDIDVMEYHHKYKIDAPSGTATMISDTIKETGIESNINFHSIRAGNIVGEHSVLFTSNDNERVEISHKIYSREGFSKGLIETIKWIVDRKPGLFGIEDIFK